MTGVITSLPPLVEQPPGNNSSNPAGLPGLTYTVAILTIPQTWSAKQTFPLGNISVQAADVAGLAGSATVDTTDASNITSGTLPAGRLPNPSTSTLGGIQSLAAVGSRWINAISTAGVPSATQPTFSDISGQATLAQLPTLGANTVLGSIAGGAPIALTATQHTSLVNTFTTSLSGAVPSPGSATNKFLRDDATWATPSGGGLSGNSTVSGASTTYTSGQNNINVARSNSGSAMNDTLPGTSPGVLPANTILTITNTDTSGLLSLSAGSGATIKGSLPFNGFLYLGPGQTLQIQSDGSNYWPIGVPAHVKLGANTTINVATTGNDSTGNGTTAPFLTTAKAWAFAQAKLDLNGFVLTIQHAAGTYSVNTTLRGTITGQGGPETVILQGDTTTPTNVNIPGTGSGVSITIEGGALCQVQGFNITSSGGQGLYVGAAAVVNFQQCQLGVISGAALASSGGCATLRLTGNYTTTGNKGVEWNANGGGRIVVAANITITVSGTPAYATCFAFAQNGGVIFHDFTATFSGSATGTRWSAQMNGVIQSGGTTFPGNVGGTALTGGQFA